MDYLFFNGGLMEMILFAVACNMIPEIKNMLLLISMVFNIFAGMHRK